MWRARVKLTALNSHAWQIRVPNLLCHTNVIWLDDPFEWWSPRALLARSPSRCTSRLLPQLSRIPPRRVAGAEPEKSGQNAAIKRQKRGNKHSAERIISERRCEQVLKRHHCCTRQVKPLPMRDRHPPRTIIGDCSTNGSNRPSTKSLSSTVLC